MSLICATKVENQEEVMRNLMLVTAAGALIMIQGAAVAQSECGGIWAARCNLPKGPKKKAPDAAAAANANPNSAVAGATPPKASATGVANANPNSAAATGTTGANAAVVADAGALGAAADVGIATGLTVKGSDGTALGKVSQVIKGPDGSISRIIVTSASGRSFPVAGGKLSVSGGTVIVTDSSEQ
jgi:hypothetical protein